MSVYGGFGTRLQETAYNQLLEALLRLLQDCILTNIHPEKLKSAWNRRFLEIFYELTRLESSKYLPPKLSFAVQDLADSLSPTPKRLLLPDISASPGSEKYQSFSARSLSTNQAPLPPKAVTPTPTRVPERPLSLKNRSKRRTGRERYRSGQRAELEWQPSQRYYSHIMLNRLRFNKGLPNS